MSAIITKFIKQTLLLTIFCIIAFMQLSGQNIILGDGTATAFKYHPIEKRENYSATEMIYLQQEFLDKGVNGPAYLSGIGFYRDGGVQIDLTNVTIYLKHTNDNEFSSGTTSLLGYTQVWSGTFPSTTSSGWKTVNFSSPFYYNNSQNLQVLVINNGNSKVHWTETPPQWRHTLVADMVWDLYLQREYQGSSAWEANSTVLEILGASHRVNARFAYCEIPVKPDFVTANPNPICQGQSTTLSRSGGSGESFRWYSGSCGGTLIGSGSNHTVSPSSTTTYYGRWETADCGNSECEQVTVVVNPTPAANATNTGPYCEYETLNLSTTNVSGASYSWSGPGGWTGSGRTPIRNPAITGTYTVTVNAGGCTNTSSTNVVVNPTPEANATNTGPYCTGNVLSLSTPSVSGANYSWSGPGGWTAGTREPTRDPAIAGTYTVTVTAAGCTNTSTTNVVVNPIPTADATNTGPYCEGDILSLSTTNVSGASYSWSGPGGWTAGTREPTRNPVVAGTYTITVTALGCTNTSTTNVVVNPAPEVNAVNTGPYCEGDILSLTTTNISGASYSWSGPGGWTAGTREPTRNPAVAGTYTVTVTASGCTNTSNTDVVVYDLSTAPTEITGNNQICEGESTELTVVGGNFGEGATWHWYSGNCGGTPEGTGESITVSPDNTSTYYVRAEGVCNETGCAEITVIVNTLSTAPTEISESGNNEVCEGESTELTVVGGSLGTGANWHWYSGNCGETPEGTGQSIIVSPENNTTYYVRAESNCNITECVEITITVNELSITPAEITGDDEICEGESADLTVIGGSLGEGAIWHWYSGNCGETPEGTGENIIVSPESTTTYYVRAEGDCNNTDCAEFTVIVNTLSIAPTEILSEKDTICEGEEIDLTVIGGSLGTGATWEWYIRGCGDVHVGTGESITVSPANTTTYYVRAEGLCNETECDSITIHVINISDDPTQILGNDEICEGEETELIVDGGSLGTAATWEWYSDNCGENNIATGESINVTPENTTTYYVRAENECNITECAEITVIVNTFSIVPDGISGNNEICEGDQTELTIIGGSLGTEATWEWYSDNCGENNIGIGESITVSPDSTATYYVRAEGYCNITECVEFSVVVNPIPVANAENTGPYCERDTISLITPDAGEGAEYYWEGPSGFNSTEQNPEIISVTANMDGIYEVTVTLAGCANTSSTNVVVYALPIVNAQNTGPYCVGETISLLTPDAGEGAEYYWEGPSDFNSTEQNPLITQATRNMSGIYELTVTLNNCTNTSSTDVLVDSTYNVKISPAGPFCYGDYSINLDVDTTGGTWTGQGVTANGTFNVADAGIGTHNIFYSIPVNCGGSDIIQISVFMADFYIDYNTTDPLCIGGSDGSVDFTVIGGNPPYIFEWNNDGYSNTLNITGLSAGEYTFTITDTDNCSDIINVVLNESTDDCLKIPNAFSPNGDGINDTWLIENINAFPDFYLQVFNRWGQQVFTARHGDDPWNGTYNGNPLPSGPYLYLIDFGKEIEPAIGIVTIVR